MPSLRSVSPLDSHLGYWLRSVSNHVSYAFSQKLAAREVTVAEWVLLRELYEHERMAPSRLAAGLHMTRGAISKLVDRLAAKALVRRSLVKGDRRYQDVALTAAGRVLVPKLAALADTNDDEFFGHLKSDERATIETFLKDIVRRAGITDVPVD